MKAKNCNIIHLSETSSTNEYAKALLQKEKPAEGTLIIADHQSLGKGLDSNTWESEAGKNILMSMIFYPDFLKVEKQFIISMAIALGIVDFLKSLDTGNSFSIKWPNDIYSGKQKIGGILISNEILGEKFEHVIVGMGININQEKFSETLSNPGSLSLLTGEEFNLPELVEKLRDSVTARYEQLRDNDFDPIRDEYHKNLLGLDEWRKFTYKGKQIRGKITGISEFGHLKLETEGNLIECDLKEIAFML